MIAILQKWYVIVLILLAGCACIFYGIYQNTEKPDKDGKVYVKTYATAESQIKEDLIYVSITYTVDGETYHTRVKYLPKVSAGETVLIKYNEADPTEVISNAGDDSVGFLVAGPLLIVLGIILMRKNRKKEEA